MQRSYGRDHFPYPLPSTQLCQDILCIVAAFIITLVIIVSFWQSHLMYLLETAGMSLVNLLVPGKECDYLIFSRTKKKKKKVF